MNTLTQQQINQYQWQVADGMARMYSKHIKREDWNLIYQQYQTNAPDGIYSGEALELIERKVLNEQIAAMDDVPPKLMTEENLYDKTLFLQLKPSHLPAVLTTQPGEEWKDRYNEVFKRKFIHNTINFDWEYITESEYSSQLPKYIYEAEWHLITPPAEQEAETVDNNGTIEPVIDCGAGARSAALWLDDYCNKSLPYHNMVSDAARKAANHIQQLQSTLTQKDQRIAELEQMVDQCQKNDLYFEQEKEQLNNKIAELGREREWVSVDDRLPEDKTRVLCVAVHPNGNKWIQIYRYSTDIGFDWMHDYEPILWMLLPPQH